ncbi:MAG: HlyD family secretion protein [Bacillota bacterium]
MKKRLIAVLSLLIVAAGAYWGYQRYYTAGSDAILVSGTIEATEINLMAKLPGTLKFVSVRPGDKIAKGQIVAGLDREDLIIQRERDALGVEKAGAALADLTSGARQQEIDEANALLNTARANYENARAEALRARSLYQSGALSQAELDKAETALEIYKNQMNSAESKLSLLKSGSRPEQINAARIEVERSKTVLENTEKAIEDTKISSPIDGTVISRNFEPGEFVAAGTPVVTVADLNDLWIRIYVPTDNLPGIKIGQQVNFTVSGVDDVFTGTIEEISSKGEFTPKMIQTKQERTNIVYAVKVRIENRDGLFKPGMPADVVIGGLS